MSEFSLIYRHFKNATKPNASTVLGIGDDCAASQILPNHHLVSCMDTLVAGRHFPINTSAYAIGYKSVAVNLSDLASMGATPFGILLGLSLPEHLANDEFLSEFTRGISDICGQFHVELIGGDTTKSDILTICVTALGTIKNGQAIRRSGAKIGDIICVSGEIGSASFALENILQHGRGVLNAPNSAIYHTLDCPKPHVDLGQKLVGFASSMIDISDGLGQDLGHILSASQVGAMIDLSAIPTNPLLLQLPYAQKWQHQLNGGDDYQLCLTINHSDLKKFNQLYPDLIYPIGKIVRDEGLQLFFDKKPIEFKINGWNHFNTR